MIVNDDTAKAKANGTFTIQFSHIIVTYDCQNIFILQATENLIPPHCYLSVENPLASQVANTLAYVIKL